MAWQQSDLDTIRANIASGVMRTRFSDGREVTYQSLDQLLAAEKVIAAALAIAENAARGLVSRKFATYRSGF